MRKIGKSMMILCAALMIVLTAAACGGKEEAKGLNVEGSWKIALYEEGLAFDQITMYKTYLEGLETKDSKLQFKSDSQVTISAVVKGEKKSTDGSYSINGNTVTVIDPMGYAVGTAGTITMEYKNGKLVVDSQGQHYLCFVKE